MTLLKSLYTFDIYVLANSAIPNCCSHLQGPPGESRFCPRVRVCAQATLARAAYLAGAFRPSFLLTVTPKVSGVTVVNGASTGVAGRGPKLSQDI